ncbi:MAG: hypothetical protein H6Q84_1322 [Deltaproteobacteria bacterium]|jgi:hypothetical protein|nr:hypothetical protein [Deltaproteobacteria bacterium]
MKSLLLVICIWASTILFMSLAEAALTKTITAVLGLSTLLLLGCGLVGLGVYGRRRFKK